MASLDLDLLRHALKTAQEHCFAEVELGVDGGSFRASLQAGSKKKRIAELGNGSVAADKNGEADLKLIKSPIVGYYSIGKTPLELGKSLKQGDVVAVVNALGIANDVEATVSGEIVEVLVNDGQAVEFGQVLAKVKA